MGCRGGGYCHIHELLALFRSRWFDSQIRSSLTVQLRSDPSIAGAQLTYQDACGQRQSLPISAPLQELLERKTGRVFEKVLAGGARSSSAPDGSVDVALGLAHADLAIPRKGNKSYPATVTLGLDFAYTAADGTILYSKKIQSSGRGAVELTENRVR